MFFILYNGQIVLKLEKNNYKILKFVTLDKTRLLLHRHNLNKTFV